MQHPNSNSHTHSQSSSKTRVVFLSDLGSPSLDEITKRSPSNRRSPSQESSEEEDQSRKLSEESKYESNLRMANRSESTQGKTLVHTVATECLSAPFARGLRSGFAIAPS